MDAFEYLVAQLFSRNGYWTQTSFKIPLTKEEKVKIGRYSSPRWEIDVLAYHRGKDEVLALECKSYLDSPGVKYRDLQPDSKAKTYKLFREQNTRDIVLERLRLSLIEKSMIGPDTTVRIGMVAGNSPPKDRVLVREFFSKNDWAYFDRTWLVDNLQYLSQDSYENEVSSMVAKILLRK